MTLPEDEMPIDGEVATATIASSVDPIEIHEGEETGAEEPMEVEDETEREGLLLQRQGRTAAPVIWSGSVRNEHDATKNNTINEARRRHWGTD
ncbi:hypothetical protein BHE74_00017611 [Ensete ventricosum]|nr:hypothetical protein GW17_00024283 [Ensete ventricosum]RWW74453.1 hypothetical protein BHE74_00017611 [Ensete ventricosum]RZR92140.1 hypothetical protein BHM03_00020388 [Ensete ventricosum]